MLIKNLSTNSVHKSPYVLYIYRTLIGVCSKKTTSFINLSIIIEIKLNEIKITCLENVMKYSWGRTVGTMFRAYRAGDWTYCEHNWAHCTELLQWRAGLTDSFHPMSLWHLCVHVTFCMASVSVSAQLVLFRLRVLLPKYVMN